MGGSTGMKKVIWTLYGIALCLALCITLRGVLREKVYIEEKIDITFKDGKAETAQIGGTYQLRRGVYQVTVDYEAGTTNHYIFAASQLEPRKTGCDRLLLERAKEQEAFQVWVSGEVEDFRVLSEYAGVGDYSISRMTLRETGLGMWHDLFLILLAAAAVFFLLKLSLEGFFNRERLTVFLGLLGITLLASVPLYLPGVYLGHDGGFHLNRLEGVWQGLASGQFPVRIQPNWLHGYGYAISVCYGDILLYIPAGLRLLGFPVQEAYEWFVFLVNGAVAAISYGCWKKMFHNSKAALFGSFLYTLSVYRLANVYTRSAVGEYCAMIFLPLVVYGFWCILGEESDRKKKNWIPLTIGFTGLLQTHLLSCEMAGLFSAFVCVLLIRRVLKRENFLALCKAVVGTLLVNAWFLIPFLDYMLRENMKINTEVLSGEPIQELGVTVEQMFRVLMHGTGIPLIETMPGQQRYPWSIGLGLQIALVLGLFVWLRYKKQERAARWSGMFFLLSSVALIGATKYFPWDFLIASGLGFLASIQFPWRFLGIAVVLLCTMACCGFYVLEKNRKKAIAGGCAVLILAASVVSSGYMVWTYMESAKVYEDYEQRDAPYEVANGEFMPSDIIFSEEAFHPVSPVGAHMEIKGYVKKYNRIVVECCNLLDEENILQVPILLYRGYQAYDKNTKERFPLLRTETGMTGIGLPAGYEGTLCMEFQEPFVWRVADFISIISILVLICYKKNIKFIQSLWHDYRSSIKGTSPESP
ncbi:hypothetical protein D5278_05965 [bacterium 1XD21-13]|nr:hypothetical protein [bacterium 1XD21-13]